LPSGGSVYHRGPRPIQTLLNTHPAVSLITTHPIPVPGFRAVVTSAADVDLERHYKTRGCPVCDHLISVSKEFFVKFQYALYNDETEQESFAENGGFCRFHTWQLEAISSPVGFSAGCAKLVKRMSRLLEETITSSDCSRETIRHLSLSPKSCRVCSLLREAEKEHIQMLSVSLLKIETQKSYARSQGVCLPHLEMLIEASPNEEITKFLVQTTSTVLQFISEDMEGLR
jgi:hypothetical protein